MADIRQQRPFVFGISGKSLTLAESDFFKENPPLGFILFKRNLENPEQLQKLVRELKALDDRVSIWVDQEGGRVQRLRSPFMPDYPSMEKIGAVYERDQGDGIALAKLCGQLIGIYLKSYGIDVNCAPVCDIRVDGASDVIGDRSFGRKSDKVTYLAKAYAQGLMTAGVVPVMKHIPGHGKACKDSHVALPVVAGDISDDLSVFKEVDTPFAMTAHVVYSALDPDHPATLSKKVIDHIRAEGISSILISDAMEMGALAGVPLPDRIETSFRAGCEIALHCNGKLDDMRLCAPEQFEISQELQAKLDAARLEKGVDLNPSVLQAEYDQIVGFYPEIFEMQIGTKDPTT